MALDFMPVKIRYLYTFVRYLRRRRDRDTGNLLAGYAEFFRTREGSVANFAWRMPEV